MNKKTVSFITLGCKVNTAETEGMKRLFRDSGYSVLGEGLASDVYIINTCTVTNMGDRKSRQMLRRAHALNPEAIIAAVGCFAQVSPEEAAKIEGVSLVVGNNLKGRIVELVEEAMSERGSSRVRVEERRNLTEFEELPVEAYDGQTRAFLKIQDGCNQFCSYCIIPYARGPIRSRSFAEALEEANRFADKGFKEVVLTGIHLTSYGDEKEKTGLLNLIEAVHEIEGLERIRLGSLEPLFLSETFIKGAGTLPKLCPHYHISLQSGSGGVLKRMNRRYTTEEYRSIVTLLKTHIPDVAITTDVMVGFPGETEAEFQESLDFCKEMAFSWAHIFKYSPRKGTPAAQYKEQVAPELKEERSRRMLNVAVENREAFYRGFMGRTLPVLLEKEIKEGIYEGFTPNYIPIKVEATAETLAGGTVVNVALKGIEGDTMTGIVRQGDYCNLFKLI